METNKQKIDKSIQSIYAIQDDILFKQSAKIIGVKEEILRAMSIEQLMELIKKHKINVNYIISPPIAFSKMIESKSKIGVIQFIILVDKKPYSNHTINLEVEII